MESIENRPITIQEYRDRLAKKTCSIKELSEILGVSYPKTLQISRIEGFPMIRIGRDKRVILSKIDTFLESHIGDIL